MNALAERKMDGLLKENPPEFGAIGSSKRGLTFQPVHSTIRSDKAAFGSFCPVRWHPVRVPDKRWSGMDYMVQKAETGWQAGIARRGAVKRCRGGIR